MGRYVNFSDGTDFKFWFAVQLSADILDFGHKNEDIINGYINFEDLDRIKKQVERLKKDFNIYFNMSYEKFIDGINKKGYYTTSREKEAQTKKHLQKLEIASKINLGEHIIKSLENSGDDLTFEAEC